MPWQHSQGGSTKGDNPCSSLMLSQAVQEGKVNDDGMSCMIGFLVNRATSVAWQRLKQDKSMDDSQLVIFLLQCYDDRPHPSVCPYCHAALQRFCSRCSTVIDGASHKHSDFTATPGSEHGTTSASGKECGQRKVRGSYFTETTSHKPGHTLLSINTTKLLHSGGSRSNGKSEGNAACVYSDINCSLAQTGVFLDVDDPDPQWNLQDNEDLASDTIDDLNDEDHLGVAEGANTADETEGVRPSNVSVSSNKTGKLREASSDRWETKSENETLHRNEEAQARSRHDEASEQYTEGGEGFKNEFKADVKVEAQAAESTENCAEHAASKWTKLDIVRCRWCAQSFKTIVALTKHLTVHTTAAWQTNRFSLKHHGKAAGCPQSTQNTTQNCRVKLKTRFGRTTRSQTPLGAEPNVVDSGDSTEKSPVSASCQKVFPYHCLRCGEGAKTPVGLTHHMQCAHVKTDTYGCLQCRETFGSVRGIACHVRTHPATRMRQRDSLQRDPATHPHQCGQCGKRFMYVGNLANHMERHTGCSQVWCCSQCQSRFPSMTELTSHHCKELREQQEEEDCGQYTNGRVSHVSLPGSRNSQPFSASSCGIEMPEEGGPEAISLPRSGKETSERHRNTLNTIPCPELSSDPASEVNKHKVPDSKTDPASEVHKHKVPDSKTDPASEVHKHKVPDSKTDPASEKKEQEEEGDEVSENQVSEKCVKKGRKRKNLSPGMKEPPRPYKCSECPAMFQHASVLKLHSQKHSGKKAFPCAQCQQSFTSKTKLLKHQEKDHWEGMPITCQECGKVFSTARGLDEHRVLHTGERPYVCETCGERFPYRTALTRHRRSHRGSYFRCQDCGAEFHLKSLYTNHVDEHHRTVKPHLCSHCGQAFGSLAALKRHADTHGKKQFVCELCGKEFRKRGEHKMHLLTHQSVKPFPCPLCPRSFVSRCKLKLHHSLTHLGIKPFACKLCPATFSCATYLKDHMRLAHSTERMFACPLCPSRFAARRFLRLHLKRTHKKSKVEVRNAERESLLGLTDRPDSNSPMLT